MAGELKSRYAAMFTRVKATKAANEEQAKLDHERRLTCPVEQAKNILRRRGWTVFAESVLNPASKQIIVGRTAYSPEYVVAWAERLMSRSAA